MIDLERARNESDLALQLGISRVAVSQYIALLKLNPDVIKTIEDLGDPIPKCIISKRKLYSLVKLPTVKQKTIIQTLKS